MKAIAEWRNAIMANPKYNPTSDTFSFLPKDRLKPNLPKKSRQMSSGGRYDATELTAGTCVAVLAFVLGALIYHHQQSGGLSGYDLDVHLARSDGLSTGSDVRLSGVKVGEVSGSTLDHNTYLATVHMNISDGIRVPKDSLIEVTVDGLLGNPYLRIHPGKSKIMLPAGGVITRSCGSVDITSLIGRLGLMNGQSFCDQ